MTVITRIFDDYTAARSAQDKVQALTLPGVEVSILGNETLRDSYGTAEGQLAGLQDDAGGAAITPTLATPTGAGIGATVGGGAGLLVGLGLVAIPGIGPLVAAGWLAATAVGAAGGALAGGAVGAMVDLGLSEEDGPVFSEAMRRGGIAVSVRCAADDRAAVEAALDQHVPTSLTERRASYEADGWTVGETETDRAVRTGGPAIYGRM